ncbi:MAG: hypothetical protein HQL08_08670 [Nitrospirae bacterium]|nr:hypothetical protein [Nitrospirota bacterium]
MAKTLDEIDRIKEILPTLSDEAVREARTFVDYLADRQRRRKALVRRVLKAEKETPIRFKTVKEAMKAIRDEARI